MERIESFKVNHDTLKPGIYISRIDGDITTYDIRFKYPNSGDYLNNAAMHTIEHLAATFTRNSTYKENIIYFGPMGCRTGFYFLVRDLENLTALNLITDTIKFIADYEGDIPGATKIECGNYLEHNLEEAKNECKKMYKIIKDYSVNQLSY